jgi:hypothetical protein
MAADAGDDDVSNGSDATGTPDSATVTDTRAAEDTSTVDTGAPLKDSGSDAAVDAVTCPPITINCSTTCGGESPECAQIDCRRGTIPYIFDFRFGVTRAVIRLPDKPGNDPDCATRCSSGFVPPAYQVAFEVKINADAYVRLRAPTGWVIWASACNRASVPASCSIKHNSSTTAPSQVAWTIATDNPLVSMGDLVIEVVGPTDTCP